MRLSIVAKLFCLLLVALCCVACTANDTSDGQPGSDGSAASNEIGPYHSYSTGAMDFNDWQSVYGTQQITLPDLYDTDKNINPYFLAEVIETHADYFLVKPRADISLKNTDFVSYSAELLKHSESYIIPRALMTDSHYLTDEDATVGDLVKITFNSLQVYRDTVYGETPVMKIVFYFSPLSADEITSVQ